jgi:DNA-binding NtrC family response regulator
MCEVLTANLEQDYDVTSFTSPREALACLLEGSFDLVLCDLMMPELNGMDLFDRLSGERPDMNNRFIVITGGAFTERARGFLRQTRLPTIAKPFARRELMAAIQATLEAARDAR